MLETFSLHDINNLYKIQNQYLFDKLREVVINDYPYKHIEIEGLFHKDFYNFMKLLMPDISQMPRFKNIPGVPKDYPEQRFAFFIKTSHFGHSYMYDSIENKKLRFNLIKLYNWFNEVLCPNIFKIFDMDIKIKTHDELAYMVDTSGFSLKAHTDIPQKILTVLIYMPDDSSLENFGTNILVPISKDILNKRSKNNEDFRVVKTTKFIPNNTFIFQRSDISFHNVDVLKHKSLRKFLLFTAMSTK